MSTMKPQEILDRLVELERANELDNATILDLTRSIYNQLSNLSTVNVFSLIRNSNDLKEDEAYWTCIRALHSRPEIEVFNQANNWSNDADPDRRQTAADILAKLGSGTLTNGVEYPFASQSTPVINRLLDDDNVGVICSALHACGHLKICEPKKIVKFAINKDPFVRYATVHALCSRSDPVSLEAQIALSQDEDRDVRNWATFYLGWLEEVPNTIIDQALLERIADSDPEIRGEALIGLAKRKNPLVLEPLKAELAGEFHGGWAIDAAWELKSPELIPSLENLRDKLPTEDKEYFEKVVDNAILECNFHNSTKQL